MGNICIKLNISESKPRLKRNPSIEKIKKEYYEEKSKGFHKSTTFNKVNQYAYNLQTKTWDRIKFD